MVAAVLPEHEQHPVKGELHHDTTNADATEGNCRAIPLTNEPSALLTTAPVAPVRVSAMNAPSVLIFKNPADGRSQPVLIWPRPRVMWQAN